MTENEELVNRSIGNNDELQNSIIDYNLESNRQVVLDFQLKLVQIYGPILGIYSLPSLSNPEIWNSIIFIRNGYYKEGKFKFDIDLTEFPQSKPKITFRSKLFHPMVNQVTGEADMAQILTENWNYGQNNMLYNVLNDIKKMFLDRKKLQNKFSLNSAAAKLLQTKPHHFIEKALRSVELSNDQFLNNENGTSLIFSNSNQIEKEQLKQTLQSVINRKDLNLEQKKQWFMKKLLE